MNVQGKIWGWTTCLESNNTIEVHKIKFKANSKCSKHKHNTKANAFYCLSGQLLIRVWKNNYELVDETLLKPGDFTVVPPGEFHEFEGVEDGGALEIYWAEFDPNDIVRESVGMVKSKDGKKLS